LGGRVPISMLSKYQWKLKVYSQFLPFQPVFINKHINHNSTPVKIGITMDIYGVELEVLIAAGVAISALVVWALRKYKSMMLDGKITLDEILSSIDEAEKLIGDVEEAVEDVQEALETEGEANE
tara:strand:+ start:769 stop:1140 length:372 start_codon:yes stop_codon:yes gene_type:complete